MTLSFTRRALLIGATLLTTALSLPAIAQDKPVLRFSAVFSEQDIRAEMMKQFGDAVAGDFTLEPYYGGNLFKQGTELVALQRGNLEMGNIAPQDISNQIPAWSVLTSGYLFRDAAHLRAFFDSEVGAEYKKMAEDQLGVHILGPTYFGIRQVGLRGRQGDQDAGRHGRHQAPHAGRRRLAVPRHGARRQPDADGLCRSLYRPPDRRDRRPGQSAAERREHEVLRSDVADRADLAPRRLRPARRQQDRLGRDDARAAGGVRGGGRLRRSTSARKSTSTREAELLEKFKGGGLKIYEPDVAAFRTHVQDAYLASDLAKSWEAGIVDKINAL